MSFAQRLYQSRRDANPYVDRAIDNDVRNFRR